MSSLQLGQKCHFWAKKAKNWPEMPKFSDFGSILAQILTFLENIDRPRPLRAPHKVGLFMAPKCLFRSKVYVPNAAWCGEPKNASKCKNTVKNDPKNGLISAIFAQNCRFSHPCDKKWSKTDKKLYLLSILCHQKPYRTQGDVLGCI